MRIQEIFEAEQLDEISLSQNVGKVTSKVGNVVGKVKGTWQGAKDAYTTARDTAFGTQRAKVANPFQTNTTTATPQANTTPNNAAQVRKKKQSTAAQAAQAQMNRGQQQTQVSANTTANTGKAKNVVFKTNKTQQAIDQVVAAIQSLPGAREKQSALNYANTKLSSVKEDKKFHSKFLDMDI